MTFSAVTTGGNITTDYEWEDSTNTGIADFTKSGTRTAGQGFIFRQDDEGGALQNVMTFVNTEYCFHKLRTWALNITTDDTNSTNLPWRDKVGIPNWRAAVDTGDGIYYIDDVDENNPILRIVSYDNQAISIIPIPISEERLNLSGYLFDKAACIEWNDYILFACRTSDSTINNRVIAYNKVWKSFDFLNIFVS